MLVPIWMGTNMASHTNLYKFGWHTSASSARIKYSRDLILGKVVHIAIIYHIPDSWIYLWNGYDFYFWSHDWWKPRISWSPDHQLTWRGGWRFDIVLFSLEVWHCIIFTGGLTLYYFHDIISGTLYMLMLVQHSAEINEKDSQQLPLELIFKTAVMARS